MRASLTDDPRRRLCGRDDQHLLDVPASEPVAVMDRRTHEGITTGTVTLPRRPVHVGVWFRLLSTRMCRNWPRSVPTPKSRPAPARYPHTTHRPPASPKHGGNSPTSSSPTTAAPAGSSPTSTTRPGLPNRSPSRTTRRPSDRLRRNVITAQKAAGAAIEDLTGRRIQGWGDDEDGAGDPYWSAHLHQADPEINP